MTTTLPSTRRNFDVAAIRRDFPILQQTIRGKRLVYLDSANTSQKPTTVIDSMNRFYTEYNSNVHRATHLLSEKATKAYEDSRVSLQRFINARSTREVIFTRGCTESINLVAHSWGRKNLKPGDEIVVSWMEHHSNIVPWQLVAEETGAVLRVIPITESGELMLDEYEKLLGPQTKLVSIIHVSNALGTINPVKEMIEAAHRVGAVVLVDGAQAVPHSTVNVQDLDADFYTFSSHKMFGPTGVGVLYGKSELLEQMPPFLGGGDMIESVTFARTTYNELPYKFEAGTPNIAGVIGFGAAADYLLEQDMDAVAAHEHDLLVYGTERLLELGYARIYGTSRNKASVISFVLEGVHPHDIGTILDQEGVAIRTGQHCAQPIMDKYGIPATARASFALYNTRDEVDALIGAVKKAKEFFG